MMKRFGVVPRKIRYHQGETGWALPLRKENCVSINNVPFDGGVVNLNDVVQIRQPEDWRSRHDLYDVVVAIEERTYHVWSSVQYRPTSKERYDAIRRAIQAKGWVAEGDVFGRCVVASNAQDEQELLAVLGTAGTGTAAILKHLRLPPAPILLSDLDKDYGAPAPGNRPEKS